MGKQLAYIITAVEDLKVGDLIGVDGYKTPKRVKSIANGRITVEIGKGSICLMGYKTFARAITSLSSVIR